MIASLTSRDNATALKIVPLEQRGLQAWLGKQSKSLRAWVSSNDFRAKPGEILAVAGRDGSISRVLAGIGSGPWAWASIASKLQKGRYRIEGELTEAQADDAALGWALAAYEFSRYRKPRRKKVTLVWPEGASHRHVERIVRAVCLARDLINTPASDMGPAELAEVARGLAEVHGAEFRVVEGEALLEEGYPTIHAVGKGSERAPRLIDLVWGDPGDPKVALIGKGVCFDSGGLDLKTAAGMKLMKKDMGGAAIVLGLAQAVMDAKLPIFLRVLIPAVENSLSDRSMRPLDVIKTRKGLTVEIGNTDAEGRLVLADALAEADAHRPDWIIDVATLTGAARVALGAELPALFSNDEGIAAAVLGAGERVGEPLWRLPLHDAYRRLLDSPIADLNNIASSAYGGAITAALFLREFVSSETRWAHIDTMAYNLDSRPGRPTGGEAMALRPLFAALHERYPGKSSFRPTKKARKKT